MASQASMCIARPSSLLGKSLKTKQTAGNTRTRSAFNVHAKMTKKGGKGAAYRARPAAGFVEEDNSGKSNIFGVEPKTLYTSSPRSQEAASQGIGGAQGAILLGVVLAVVAAVTLGVFKLGDKPPQTLTQAGAGLEGTSLSQIANRLEAGN